MLQARHCRAQLDKAADAAGAPPQNGAGAAAPAEAPVEVVPNVAPALPAPAAGKPAKQRKQASAVIRSQEGECYFGGCTGPLNSIALSVIGVITAFALASLAHRRSGCLSAPCPPCAYQCQASTRVFDPLCTLAATLLAGPTVMIARPMPRVLLLHTGGTLGMDAQVRPLPGPATLPATAPPPSSATHERLSHINHPWSLPDAAAPCCLLSWCCRTRLRWMSRGTCGCGRGLGAATTGPPTKRCAQVRTCCRYCHCHYNASTHCLLLALSAQSATVLSGAVQQKAQVLQQAIRWVLPGRVLPMWLNCLAGPAPVICLLSPPNCTQGTCCRTCCRWCRRCAPLPSWSCRWVLQLVLHVVLWLVLAVGEAGLGSALSRPHAQRTCTPSGTWPAFRPSPFAISLALSGGLQPGLLQRGPQGVGQAGARAAHCARRV